MLVSDFAQTCMTTKAVKTLNQNMSTPIFVFLGAYDGVIFYVYPTAEKVANLKNIGVRNIDTKKYNTTLNKNYFALFDLLKIHFISLFYLYLYSFFNRRFSKS